MPYPKKLKIGSLIRHPKHGAVGIINCWRTFNDKSVKYAMCLLLGSRTVFFVREDKLIRKTKHTNDEYLVRKEMRDAQTDNRH